MPAHIKICASIRVQNRNTTPTSNTHATLHKHEHEKNKSIIVDNNKCHTNSLLYYHTISVSFNYLYNEPLNNSYGRSIYITSHLFISRSDLLSFRQNSQAA